MMGLPKSRYDFSSFYSEKPDADLFVCRALAAGVVSIYLEITDRAVSERGRLSIGEKDQIQDVIRLFNAFLEETSERKKEPFDFDPFIFDIQGGGSPMDEKTRSEYFIRTKKLVAGFEREFGGRYCVEILGFDPFRYDEYDERTQERIEEGGWMESCVACMRNVIKELGKAV